LEARFGGRVPGSMVGDAVEIFEEGLIIPPVKLFEKGRARKDILEMILANSRTPKMRMGDIYAQVAASRVGEKRILKLIEKYGENVFRETVDEILNYSERRIRSEIRKLPKGSYSAEDYMDDSGVEDKPVKIKVTIEISGDEMKFDFSGTDKQVRGPINCPFTVTLSCSYFVLRAITDPTIPANEGTYRPLKVFAPDGTIVNAKPSAAVSGIMYVSGELILGLVGLLRFMKQ